MTLSQYDDIEIVGRDELLADLAAADASHALGYDGSEVALLPFGEEELF